MSQFGCYTVVEEDVIQFEGWCWLLQGIHMQIVTFHEPSSLIWYCLGGSTSTVLTISKPSSLIWYYLFGGTSNILPHAACSLWTAEMTGFVGFVVLRGTWD